MLRNKKYYNNLFIIYYLKLKLILILIFRIFQMKNNNIYKLN